MKHLLAGLAILGALSGCGVAGQEVSTQQSEPAPVTATPAPTERPAPTDSQRPQRPEHLTMAGIAAPVVPLSMSGTTLTPPSDPTVLGWWGRPVGARHGVTLLVGHTVHTGGGALDDLEDVPVGTIATVSGHRYEVRSDTVLSKAVLAKRAAHLFSQDGRPRLVIVTCEDYDAATGHYRSNVVVTATPV